MQGQSPTNDQDHVNKLGTKPTNRGDKMTTEILALDIGYGYTKGLTARAPAIVSSLVGPAEAIRFESDVILENGKGIALEVN